MNEYYTFSGTFDSGIIKKGEDFTFTGIIKKGEGLVRESPIKFCIFITDYRVTPTMISIESLCRDLIPILQKIETPPKECSIISISYFQLFHIFNGVRFCRTTSKMLIDIIRLFFKEIMVIVFEK